MVQEDKVSEWKLVEKVKGKSYFLNTRYKDPLYRVVSIPDELVEQLRKEARQ